MSSTDQAFIRAYQETVRSPRTATASAHTHMASAELVDNILSRQNAEWQDTQETKVKSNTPIQTVHRSDVNADFPSAIPAPHFARPQSRTAASPTSTFGALEQKKTSHSLNSPHLAFGNSPKVALSAFTSGNDFGTFESSAMKPAFEVDAVRWPELCQTLLSQHGSSFSQFADSLRQSAAEGHKVLAVTGLSRTEGRTTLVLCLAKHLAASRIRVAVVDADFASPNLAHQLNVNVTTGWENALSGEQSVWDVMIEATTDQLTLVPLATTHNTTDTSRPVYGIAAILAELAEQFDVVLVDAGPLRSGEAADWLLDPAAGIQGVILTHDARRNSASHLAAACLQLAETGVRQLGIAETFVTEQTCK